MTRKIHFLNVKNGDCIIFQRDNNISIIDLCCGNIDYEEELIEASMESIDDEELAIRGNFNMRDSPTNPVDYLKKLGIKKIFRFILSHPDMDHMDGIKELFTNFSVTNFWDNGIRREKPNFNGGPYLKDDWEFYSQLISGKVGNTKIVTPKAGSKGKYWNAGDNPKDNGHYINILSPTNELVELANKNGNINDASYVLLYRNSLGKVLFCGDSEDKTWNHILENHTSDVKDAQILIAPHHGRDSKRNWDFIKVVNPTVTLIGNARSKHLNYKKYNQHSKYLISNNQAGNIVIEFESEMVHISVQNEAYAKKYPGYTKDGDNYRILSIPKRQ